ncbi:MAG: hypothetical protein ACJ764_08360 [Solirubrobacteraceae bacterium]
MNPQLSFVAAQCHQSDLRHAAELEQFAAAAKDRTRPSRRFRLTIRSRKSAPLLAAKARVA